MSDDRRAASRRETLVSRSRVEIFRTLVLLRAVGFVLHVAVASLLPYGFLERDFFSRGAVAPGATASARKPPPHESPPWGGVHPLVRAPSIMSHRSRSRDRELDQLRKQLHDATTALDAARVALEGGEGAHDATKVAHDATKEQARRLTVANDKAVGARILLVP